MEHILAVDGGGSKCDALLMTTGGQVLAYASVRPDGNSEATPRGAGRSSHAVANAIGRVIAAAGRQFAVLHLAGTSGHFEFNSVSLLRAERVHLWQVGEVAAVLAGLGETYGLVALAGTGAFGHLRTPAVDKHMDGFGPLMGDWGGGHQIGRMGLRAAIRAPSHPRHATTLLPAVARAMGFAPEDPDLITKMIWEGVRIMPNRTEVARYARVVDECARAGDKVAGRILEEAAGDLADVLFDLTDGAGVRDQALILAGAGSVIQKSDLYWDCLCRKTAAFVPRIQPKRLDVPPVAGIALEVLKQAMAAGVAKADPAAAAARMRETLPGAMKGQT